MTVAVANATGFVALARNAHGTWRAARRAARHAIARAD
jgi:hypothetical protein